MFHSFFPHVLEITQPDYSSAIGIIRTLSRIDRIFLNLPMAVARDFHCYSHVFENLGKETIPSDHAAVRPRHPETHKSRTPKQTNSQLDVQTSPFLQQLHDDHRFSADPFCARAEFKVLLHKAKKMTKRELSRQTPGCIGAKLLIASTALCAYRNRRLGTLMRCCEAWKPVEDCFDTSSFECIDFQRLSQIVASLNRGSLEAREAEVTNEPTDVDISERSCDVVRHGSLLKIALIRFPLNVLTSRDPARSLRTLLVEILRNAKLRSRISLGHRQKKAIL